MSKGTHTPERMCSGCRQSKNKSDLLRVTVGQDGLPHLDRSGKGGGRGVYFCKNVECVKRTVKNKGFLKQNGFSVTEALLEELVQAIEQGQ